MLKKFALGAFVVLALGVGVVAVGYHVILDKIGPDSTPRDFALQDDSKVVPPVVQAVAKGDAQNTDQQVAIPRFSNSAGPRSRPTDSRVVGADPNVTTSLLTMDQ